jgi:hypothetical protein
MMLISSTPTSRTICDFHPLPSPKQNVRVDTPEHGESIAGLHTVWRISLPPSRPAFCGSAIVLFGFLKTAIVVACGTSSRRNPNRFAAKSTVNRVTSVILPPERLKLATRLWTSPLLPPAQQVAHLSLSPAELDDSITTIEEAHFIQAAPERLYLGRLG